jgi:lipoprotein-releasing system permease protein
LNFLFAWRYFKAKKSTNAINIIAWVSVGAIVVITAAFIILLSVFNGFEGLVKSLYSSFYSDLRIVPASGNRLTITPDQLKQLSLIQGVASYSVVVEERALLQNGETLAIVYLKGVDSNYKYVTDVANKLVRGEFHLGTEDQPAIILGSGIENALAIQADRTIYPLTVYLFKRGVNINSIDPYQAFSAETIAPSGTFFIQQDIDNRYAITNLAFMRRMLGMKPNESSAIEISLTSPYQEANVTRQIKKFISGDFRVESRYEQNKSLYSVMALEKWAIYGILTLMLIVAAFTMIGALTMLVLEKNKDIQVLKAMGAPNKLIQRIFLSEGLLLAGIGAITGILLAILICWAQVRFKLVAIQGGTFLIDYYPVKMVATDFILVLATVMLIATIASWFPSRKASLQPIELKS